MQIINSEQEIMKYINYVGCWRIYIPYIQARGAFMCRGISGEVALAYFSDKMLKKVRVE